MTTPTQTPDLSDLNSSARAETLGRSASWAILGLAVLLVALSLAVSLYRLALPDDGYALWTDDGSPLPGLTIAGGAQTLLAVEGRPTTELIAGARRFDPQRPPNWAIGQIIHYIVFQDGRATQIERRLHARPSWSSENLLDAPTAVYVLIGAFVFWRRPRNLAAGVLLLFSASLLASTICHLVTNGWAEFGVTDLFYRATFWPVAVFNSSTFNLVFLLHFFLIFPTPKPFVRRHPLLTCLGVYGQLLSLVSLASAFWPLLIFIAIGVSLWHSFTTVRDPIGRAQLRWMAWGVAFPGINYTLILLVGLFAPGVGVSQPTIDAALTALYSLTWLTMLVFPVAIAVAILRYQLFAIDTVINRTLVFAALTASVIGVYALAIGVLGLLFQRQGNALLTLAATGVTAALCQPLREWLQRGVNRLLYGERDEPYAALTRLGQRLEATLSPNALLATIVETVSQALKLPYVAIALRVEESLPVGAVQDAYPAAVVAPRFGIVAHAGRAPATPPEQLVVLPLSHQRQVVGQLLLAPRDRSEPLSGADRRLLDELARRAGAAIYTVHLTDDLQRARERLVTAREEERRRLRRDLHDGLGPALASQALTLDTAMLLLRRDPDATLELLQALKHQSQQAISDIRQLVYALRPPALDELGLVDAVGEHIHQHEHGQVEITIDAPALPPLPAAVEVAAYRIVQEALTNVVRHAHARTCVVRLRLASSDAASVLELRAALDVEINDDGCGIAEERRAGVGMTSMRERAEELGGELLVARRPGGGTHVRARLPIPPDAAATTTLLAIERSGGA